MKNWSLLVVLFPTAVLALAAGNPHHRTSTTTNNNNPSLPTKGRRNFLTGGAAAALSLAFFAKPAQAAAVNAGGRVQYGDEELMRQKGHGTSESPVQTDLLYGVDNRLADKIWYVPRRCQPNNLQPPCSRASLRHCPHILSFF
jgi:hypothetical protein